MLCICRFFNRHFTVYYSCLRSKSRVSENRVALFDSDKNDASASMIAEPEYSPQPPHQSIGQGGKAFDYRHLVPGLTFLLCVLRKSFPTERTQGLLKPSAFLFVTQLGSTRHFDLDERKFLAMKARDIPSTERRVHSHLKFRKARCQGSGQSCRPLGRCRGALPVG